MPDTSHPPAKMALEAFAYAAHTRSLFANDQAKLILRVPQQSSFADARSPDDQYMRASFVGAAKLDDLFCSTDERSGLISRGRFLHGFCRSGSNRP